MRNGAVTGLRTAVAHRISTLTRDVAAGLAAISGLLAVFACRGATGPARASIWTTLAAHDWYTCGLSAAAEAYCWGGTPGGWRGTPPLADSLAPNSAVPLRVPGGRRFIEITVGEQPICAIDSLRVAYCWGPNQAGDVGDGSYLAKRGPSAVIGEHRWKTIDAGMSHVCGITLNDETFCWGNNFRGALGNGQLVGGSPQPVAVVGGITFTAVWAGGGTSCALTAEGEAYCWGINDHGRLGDGETPEPFQGERDTESRRRRPPLRCADLGRLSGLWRHRGSPCVLLGLEPLRPTRK